MEDSLEIAIGIILVVLVTMAIVWIIPKPQDADSMNISREIDEMITNPACEPSPVATASNTTNVSAAFVMVDVVASTVESTTSVPEVTPTLWNGTRRESIGLPVDSHRNCTCEGCAPIPTPVPEFPCPLRSGC